MSASIKTVSVDFVSLYFTPSLFIASLHSTTMSDRIKHSEPISIPNSHSHSRTRSASFSASSSDDDGYSPPLRTPTSTIPPPRVSTSHSPSTSPILSYFFQSPGKVSSVLPQSPTGGFASIGRGFSAKAPQEQPILEEDEDTEPAIVRHARRMSTSAGWAPAAAPRFKPAPTSDQTERGAGLLRRLSLGGALVRVC